MAYFLSLPDGRRAKFSDAMPREEAETILREKFPDLYPKSGGITGALGRGAESTLSSLRTGIAGLFNAEQAAKDAALRERSIASRYADEVGLEQLRKRYEQEGLFGGVKEVLGVQAPRAIAEQIPQVGVSLGGAFGGARLGAAAGAVFGPVGAGVGAAIGGAAGAFAPSFLQQFGANLSRQASEGKTIDAASAAAAATAQAGLETAAGSFVLGKQLVGKLIGRPVEKALESEAGKALVEQSLKRTLAGGAARGIGVEVPTEVTQSMLERLQAGLPLASDEALKEYGDTAYQTALSAPAFGALARVQERSGAKDQLEQEKVKQRQQALEQEQARKRTPEYARELNAERVQLRDEFIRIQQAIEAKSLTKEQTFDAEARQAEIKSRLREIASEIKENVPEAQRTFADIMREREEQEAAKGRPVVDEFGNVVPGLYQPRSDVDIEAAQAEGYDRMARMPQAVLIKAFQDWNNPVTGTKLKKQYPSFNEYAKAMDAQRIEQEQKKQLQQEAKDTEQQELLAKLRADETARQEKAELASMQESRRLQARQALTDDEIKQAEKEFKKNPQLKTIYGSAEEYALDKKQDETLLGFPASYVEALEAADADFVKDIETRGAAAGQQRQEQFELAGFESGITAVERRLENPRMVAAALGLLPEQGLVTTEQKVSVARKPSDRGDEIQLSTLEGTSATQKQDFIKTRAAELRASGMDAREAAEQANTEFDVQNEEALNSNLAFNLDRGRITQPIAKALGLPTTPFRKVVGGRNIDATVGELSIRGLIQERITKLEAEQKALLSSDESLLKPDGSSQLNEKGLLALRKEAQLQVLRQYLEKPEVTPEKGEGIAGSLAVSAIETKKTSIAPTKPVRTRSDIDKQIEALDKQRQIARETRDEERLANINKQLEQLREERFAAAPDAASAKDTAFQDFVDYAFDAVARLKKPTDPVQFERRVNRLEKFKAAAKRAGDEKRVRQADLELARLQESQSLLPLTKDRKTKTEQIKTRYLDALMQQINEKRAEKGFRALNKEEADTVRKEAEALLTELSDRLQARSSEELLDRLTQVLEKRIVTVPKDLTNLKQLVNRIQNAVGLQNKLIAQARNIADEIKALRKELSDAKYADPSAIPDPAKLKKIEELEAKKEPLDRQIANLERLGIQKSINAFLKEIDTPERTRIIEVLVTPTRASDTRKTEERPFADPRKAASLIEDQLEDIVTTYANPQAQITSKKGEFELRGESQKLFELRAEKARGTPEAKLQTALDQIERIRNRIAVTNLGFDPKLAQAFAEFETISKPSEELVDAVLEQTDRIINGIDMPFNTNDPNLRGQAPRMLQLTLGSKRKAGEVLTSRAGTTELPIDTTGNRAWKKENLKQQEAKQREILEARAALERDIADAQKTLNKPYTQEELAALDRITNIRKLLDKATTEEERESFKKQIEEEKKNLRQPLSVQDRLKLITQKQIKEREAAIDKLRDELNDLINAKEPDAPTMRYNLGQAELLPKIQELLRRESEVTTLEQQLELFSDTDDARVFIRSTPESFEASANIIRSIRNATANYFLNKRATERGKPVIELRQRISQAVEDVRNQEVITLKTLGEVRKVISGINDVANGIVKFFEDVKALKADIPPLIGRVTKLENKINKTKADLEAKQNSLQGTEGDSFYQDVVDLNTQLKKLESDHSDALSALYQTQRAYNELVEQGPTALTEQELSLQAALDSRVQQEREKLDSLKAQLAELKQLPGAERNIGEKRAQKTEQDKQRALVAQLESVRKEMADANDRNKRIREAELAAMDGIVSINEAFFGITNRYKVIPATRRVTTPKEQIKVLLPVTSTIAELKTRINALKKARKIAQKQKDVVTLFVDGKKQTVDRTTVIDQQVASLQQQITDINAHNNFVKANLKVIKDSRAQVAALNKQLKQATKPKQIEKLTEKISALETKIEEAIDKKNANDMSSESLNEIRGGTVYLEDFSNERKLLLNETPVWLKEQRNIEKNYQAAVERLAKKYKVPDEGVEEKIQLLIDKTNEKLRNAPSEDTKARSKLQGEIKELRTDLAALQGDTVLLTTAEMYAAARAEQQTRLTDTGKEIIAGEKVATKQQRLKPLRGGGADQRLATGKTPDIDIAVAEKRRERLALQGAKTAAARNARFGLDTTAEKVKEFTNDATLLLSTGPAGETSFRVDDEAGSMVDLKEARQKIEQVKASLPKGVKLVYAETLFDAPKSFIRALMQQGMDQDTAKVRGGVMPDGTVVIIGSNHGNMLDLETTIAHELVGHYGVDTVLGERGLDDLVFRVDSQPGGILGLAKEMGVHDEVAGTIINLQSVGASVIGQQRAAVRELIAHVEEARVTESNVGAIKRFVQEMIGALRKVFREVLGLNRYGALSASDVYYLLRQSRKVMKSGATGAYRSADGNVVFRRGEGAFPADMPTNFVDITNKLVGAPASVTDKIFGGNTGMVFRTKYIDRFEPVMRIASQMKDSLAATQMQYFLRMHDQRNNFTAEAVNNGALILDKKKRADGSEEFVVRSGGTTSLKDVATALKGIPNMNVDAANKMFTTWMAAIRAERVGLETLNFDPSIKMSDLIGFKKYIDAHPEIKAPFEQARKLYNEYNKGLVNFAVQTGALSKEQENKLLSTNDYIPYYRVQNGVVQLMLGGEISPIKIGNLKDQPYLDQLVGGNTKILDFFTSSVQNTNMFVDLALRNIATKNVAYTLRDLGTTLSPVAKIGKGDGPTGTNVIRFKERGEDMHAVIDTEAFGVPAELLVKGLEGVAVTVPQLVQMFNIPARALRLFVTRNPLYAFRQLFRDSTSAALTTGGNLIPVISSLKELGKMRQGKSEGETALRERGVLGGQVFTGTSEDLSIILRDIASGKEGWATKLAKLDALAIQGDASTRVVLYNDFRKQGLSDMEATLATLESMNFNRRGLSPSVFLMSMMVPFMNAQIQGLDVLYRSGFSKGMPFNDRLQVRKKFWQRGMLLAGLTLAYAAMMEDDEAYKNANPDEKYNNFFVYVPGFDEPVRIPIPFEVGYLFKALPEMIVNMSSGKAEAGQVFPAIRSILFNSIPGVIPQAIKPALEVATNYSFFSGRGIESEREQAFTPSQRMRSNTTEIAKTLSGLASFTVGGKEYGVSPIQIDYLIRGYFGGLGLALTSMANTVLEKPGKVPAEMRPSDMPVVGGLFQPRDAQGLINYAYEIVSNIQQRQQTYKELMRKGDDETAKEFLQENRGLISLASSAGSFRQQMGEYATYERQVRERKDMTPQQKRAELERIRQIRINYAQNFIRATAENRRQASAG